jgi:hypothetical protein
LGSGPRKRSFPGRQRWFSARSRSQTVDGKKILEMIAIESVVQTGEMIDESILMMR